MLLKYAPHLLVNHLVSRASDDTASRTRYSGAVVFVDIVESTALTDQFSRQGSDGAERLASVLNGYFGRIIDITDAHGGDTFRIDGDAAVPAENVHGPVSRSDQVGAAVQYRWCCRFSPATSSGSKRNPVVDFRHVRTSDLAPDSVRLDPCF